jgi:hypothetical protein
MGERWFYDQGRDSLWMLSDREVILVSLSRSFCSV